MISVRDNCRSQYPDDSSSPDPRGRLLICRKSGCKASYQQERQSAEICVDEAGANDVAELVETVGSMTFLVTAALADSDQDISSLTNVLMSKITVEPGNSSDSDRKNSDDEVAICTRSFADGFESAPIPDSRFSRAEMPHLS